MAGTSELHEALIALWDSGGLDAKFTAFWTATEIASFDVINDRDAAPGSAFPYCIFNIPAATTAARMSGHDSVEKHEIRNTPIEFRIHAKDSGGLSAKRVASNMAEEVIKVFGGHPTVVPGVMTLTNGAVLINQYQNDFGMRTEDSNHLWAINYLAQLDVPLMV